MEKVDSPTKSSESGIIPDSFHLNLLSHSDTGEEDLLTVHSFSRPDIKAIP
jgi:hypothetical protein